MSETKNDLLPALIEVAGEPQLRLSTGELVSLDDVDSVGRGLAELKELQTKWRQIDRVLREALLMHSQRFGTKTLHVGGITATVKGGDGVDYDAEKLRKGLARAGCPEERIGEAVVETVSYSVNRAVLRQLAGANPKYKAAIKRAEVKVERPISVSVS